MTLKDLAKELIRFSPVAITKNQEYDRQTKKVIKRVFDKDTIALDIGCHKGEILDLFLKFAPNGQYYAFEPIPDLFRLLKAKYLNLPNCHVFELALANDKGTADFNLVLDDMAFSGLKKRDYNKSFESQTITVNTDRLDDVIPSNIDVDFIKIDVEGGGCKFFTGLLKH